MKLLQSEYKIIVNQIQKASQNLKNFQFTKKRGWVSIKNLTKNNQFTFIRKEETRLNNYQKFEKIEYYHIKTENSKIERLTKSAFINHFYNWLVN